MKNKKDVKPKRKNGPDRQLPLTPQADKAVKKTTGRPALPKKAEKLPSQPAPDIAEKLQKENQALLNELSVLKAELDSQNENLKNALSELETSRDKYRHLYNATPVAYLTLDNNTLVIAANAAGSELFGAGNRGLAGSTFTSLIEPESQDTFRLTMSKMFDTGEKQSCEIDMVKTDGTIFSAYLEIAGIPKPDGIIDGVRVIAVDITERKRVENALRKSDERYRLLFENTSDGIYIIDRDMNITPVTPNLGKLLGYSDEETKGLNLQDDGLIDPESQQLAIANLQRVLAGEVVRAAEYKFVATDGTVRYQDISGSPLVRDGKIVAAVCVARDITKRKKAEEALQKSEEKYRTLIENASEGITIIQEKDYFAFFNASFLAMSGYDADEIRSRPYIEFIVPEDRDKIIDSYRRRLKGEQSAGTNTFRFIHKSGDIRWLEVSFTLIEWEGKPATLNFLTDITERKKAEEALQHERDWAKELLDVAGVMIVAQDIEGTVSLANAKACEVLGCGLEDIVGKNWISAFMPERVRDEVKDIFTKLMSGEIEPLEYFENPVLTTRGEERTIAWHNTYIRDSNGHIIGTLSSGEDITLRKKAENKLASSEEKYRNLVENAREGIAITQDGQIKYANPKLAQSGGYTVAELMAISFIDLVHPEDRELTIQNALIRVSEEQSENRYAFRVIHKQGHIVWVETNSIMVDWEGHPATLSFMTDITERKKAAEELKQSFERYRDLFEHSGSAIVIIDENGRYLMANRKVADSYGITPEEFVLKSVYDFVPQEMADRYMKSNRRLLSTGEQREYEDTLSLPTGERSFLFIDTCLKDQNGRYFAIQSSSIDITERRKSEQSLEASHIVLKKTLNDAVNTMAKIVEIRDPYTAGHQNRVTQLCAAIAVEIGLDDAAIENLKMAAIIHDIGKIYVPAEILSKPGKLGDIEFGIIQTHPTHGYNIVKSMDLPSSIAETIVQHHERLDGSGYPNGLKGDNIILGARILAVADVVEAMVSHRPYRPAKGLDNALEEILKNRGTLYDPDIVDACVRLFSEKGFQFKESS